MFADTIVALATPPGAGGVAIIRLSGPQAELLLRKLAALPVPPLYRHMYYRAVSHKGVVLDYALCVLFEEGKSYTSELSAEIHCHGGYLSAHRILQAVIEEGARPAEPGEFTKRAFLNGKMDLTRAEAVGDMISAESTAALGAAKQALSGELGNNIRFLADEITGVLAAIGAAIDYPDEIDESEQAALCRTRVESVLEQATRLCEGYNKGKVLRQGLTVVLAGPPNAGKSSLINALSGEDVAIVSPIPGTTRDTLHAELSLLGVALHLYDTAGLRDKKQAEDIESIGIDRAKKRLSGADFILYLTDASCGFTPEDKETVLENAHIPGAVIVNKTDLISPAALPWAKHLPWPVLTVSVKTGEGLEGIWQVLKQQVRALLPEGLIITRERHFQALSQAAAALSGAKDCLLAGNMDLASIELEEAWRCLGLITGQTVTEDIIDRIFADFCVGK